MNALYLTYVILAIVYLLGKKYWDTYWLRQGNFVFLAIASTVTLIHDFAHVVIAHFSGYLMEMLAFIEGHTGQSIFLHLFLSSLIPAIGIINYARLFRQKEILQKIIWLVVVSSLLFAGLQQQSLRTYIPFYYPSTAVESGWHTVINESIGLLPLLAVLASAVAIIGLFGQYLKQKSERRTSQH